GSPATRAGGSMTDDGWDAHRAMHSLFHGSPERTGAPLWPAAAPLVIVWCPHPKRRCRMGGVYATAWGDALIRRTYPRTFRGTTIPGRSKVYPNGAVQSRGGVACTILGQPSLATSWHCRHGIPEETRLNPVGTELVALVADVRAGRIPRPADY